LLFVIFRELRGIDWGNIATETFRPIRAAHARTRAAHHATGQYQNKEQTNRNEIYFPETVL